MIVELIFILVSLFILVLVNRVWKLTLLKRYGIPGPCPNFIYGHLLDYCVMGNIGYHSHLIERYGPIVRYYLGTEPYVLVADLDLLHKVQITDAKIFLRRPRRIPGGINPDPRRRQMFGHLPVDDWMNIRKVLSPGFSLSKIKHLTDQIQNNVDKLLRKVDETITSGCNEINIVGFYEKFSLDVILETAFGYSLNIQEQTMHPLLKAVRAKFDHPTLSRWVKVNLCLPELGPIIKFVRIVIQKLTAYRGLEESHVWLTSWNAIKCRLNLPDPVHAADELQILLKGNIKLGQIAAYGVHALQGGYETLTSTLGFITFLLMQHQHVQFKVREEIMRLSQKKESGYYEFLSELKYLDFVIAEALRLWPQTTFIRRTPSEIYQFTKNGKTITFPKGIHIQIAHYQIHHSDSNWPDSNAFNPDRFENTNQTKLSITNPKWQAFGCGTRHCMGYKLALLVLKSTIASMVEKYALLPIDAAAEVNTIGTGMSASTVDPKEPVWVKVLPVE